MPAIIYSVFSQLAFGKFTIRINNRKLLRGLLDQVGIASEQQASVLHEIDRLGKLERSEVENRLIAVGLGRDAATTLVHMLLEHAGDSRGALDAMARRFPSPNPVLVEGLDELRRVCDTTLALGVDASALQIDLSIVRGLDYYTGTVYETFLDDHPKLGSICSGGRYDNLAGHYTKSKLPGVGISIGATRLFAQLLEMGVIDAKAQAIAEVLVLNVEPALAHDYAGFASSLRGSGLKTEVYVGDDKLGKQFKYADRAGVPLAIVYGSRERDAGNVKIKDLRSGSEHDVLSGNHVDGIELFGKFGRVG